MHSFRSKRVIFVELITKCSTPIAKTQQFCFIITYPLYILHKTNSYMIYAHFPTRTAT